MDSFVVIHSKDGEQQLIPRSFLSEHAFKGQTDVHVRYASSLIKVLVNHLINRSKISENEMNTLNSADRQWFEQLDRHQYVEMAMLSHELKLSWATELIVSHEAERLRRSC